MIFIIDNNRLVVATLNNIIIFEILINKQIQQNGTNKVQHANKTVATLTFERNLVKLSLSFFLIIDLKNKIYIVHLEHYELYHYFNKIQIPGSQYFNTILKTKIFNDR